MLYREFNKLKFKRTYIGGSKKNEQKILNDVQGQKNDNSDCNWFEFKSLIIKYFDDKLNILLSWKYMFNLFSIIFISIAVIISLISIYFSILVLLLSLLFQLTSQFFKFLGKKNISEYDFIITLINEQTRFCFKK